MNRHYEKIEKAIGFINQRHKEQPSLEEIANAVGLSAFHFQRLFREWAGVTPKRFLQYLTVDHAKKLLDESSVFDVALETGLSSQSRLYDHFVSLEAITPGEYKNRGQNISIDYGFAQCPFGLVFIAATKRGICQLSFSHPEAMQESIESLQQKWHNANIAENQSRIELLSNAIFNPNTQTQQKFHLYVQGTNFQVKVWESLLRIPYSTVSSYQNIACLIGAPTATRAVANAIAKNPVGFLIPCHRVIKNTGAIGGYRWNTQRKQAMLAWESANHSTKTNQDGDRPCE